MPKSTHQIKRTFSGQLGEKANRNRYLSAIVGHPDGTVYVEDRPGYVWARLGGANGQIIQVYARGVLGAYNLPIVVYHPPHRPRDYAIIDLDLDAFASSGTGEDNDGGYDGTAYAQAHAAQHYYNGGDPVLVHLRAWTPLRVYPSSGLVIGVMPGLIARAGTDLEVVHQALDLGPFAPESGALYVLITIDADGLLAATTGAAVGGLLDLTIADIPDTPAGHFRLAAIRLFSGQTSVRETRALTDIVDLRWPQERLSNAVSLDDLPTPIDIAHGGTNATSAAAAINNLLPTQAGQAGNGLLTDGSNPYWGPTGGGGGGSIVITSLPVGTLVPFGGASIPSGWLECNGAAVSRITYADLFAVVGTTYGAGDGSTTFNLPDLRGRTSIGKGTGSGLTPRALGATGGAETHTLSAAEMPAHTHATTLRSDTVAGALQSTAGQSDGSITVSYTSTSAGGGGAHNNLPPFVVTAWLIKYTDTATSALIFNDSVAPANVSATPATGSAVYAARRDHVHAHTLTDAHILVGNALNVAADVALSGDATLANTGELTLATINANVGSFGSATQVATFTVDAKGRITAAGNTTISGVTPAAHDIAGALHTTSGRTAGQVLQATGAAAFGWSTYPLTIGAASSISGTAATGSGTANYLAKWTGTNTVGNSLFQDDGTYIGIGTAPIATAFVDVRNTPTLTSGSMTGMNVILTSNPAADSAGIFQGMAFAARTQSGNAFNFTQSVRGVNGQSQHNGTGLLSTLTGIEVQTQINSSGNVTTVYGLRVTAIAPSTGRAGSNYGLYVDNNVPFTTINTAISVAASSGAGNLKYGLSIGAISGGSGANVAIETLGGQLQFTHNANSTLATFTGHSTFTATTPLVSMIRNDSATASTVDMLKLEARTTSTAAAGFGPLLRFVAESASANTYRDQAAIKSTWGRNSTPDGLHTDAGRTSILALQTVDNAGALADRISIYGALTRIGDGETNYTQFDGSGHQTMVGTATVFNDEKGNLSSAKITSPSSKVVQDDAESAYYFKDTATTADYLWLNIQFNHDRKLGSVTSPHLHWRQASATIPNWIIQYRWQKQGAAVTTAWTSIKWTSHAFTYTSGALNQITDFSDITPPSGDGISDQLQVRIIRDTGNASGLFTGADGLAGDVYVTDFDTHKESDSLGSNSEYSKT